MAPHFITFEGLDGSGKSTQLRQVARWLTDKGISHCVTHEPGGTTLGQEIRRLFLDPAAGAVDGLTEVLLVFASRRQHLVEVIEPALAEGRIVLCDRFTDSTLAYQGLGRGTDLDLIRAIDRLATGGRRPDLTLLFDISAEAARLRRNPSAQGDRLDRESLAFYERVRRGYLELVAQEPDRFRVVDASESRDKTTQEVLTLLAPLLRIEAPACGGAT